MVALALCTVLVLGLCVAALTLCTEPRRYDLSAPSSNVVEQLIQHLRPLVAEGQQVVGAEWWCHRRKVGRNLGHRRVLRVAWHIMRPAVRYCACVCVYG